MKEIKLKSGGYMTIASSFNKPQKQTQTTTAYANQHTRPQYRQQYRQQYTRPRQISQQTYYEPTVMPAIMDNPKVKVVDVHQWLQQFADVKNQPDELRMISIRKNDVSGVTFVFEEPTRIQVGMGTAYLNKGKVVRTALNQNDWMRENKFELKDGVEKKTNIPVLVENSFPFF